MTAQYRLVSAPVRLRALVGAWHLESDGGPESAENGARIPLTLWMGHRSLSSRLFDPDGAKALLGAELWNDAPHAGMRVALDGAPHRAANGDVLRVRVAVLLRGIVWRELEAIERLTRGSLGLIRTNPRFVGVVVYLPMGVRRIPLEGQPAVRLSCLDAGGEEAEWAVREMMRDLLWGEPVTEVEKLLRSLPGLRGELSR